MDFVRINGVTLHYRTEGLSDGLPLVFLNSLGTDLRIWDHLLPRLAGRCRLIRYDKRGHGLSDSPPGLYSLWGHADDLVGLLDHLAVEAAVLIGISVGGMIALEAALAYPERVRALVLSDTAAKIGTPAMWDDRIEAIRANGLDQMAPTILERWFAPTFAVRNPATYRGCYNMLTRMPAEGYIATCAAIRDADLSESVGAIEAPALVLGGAEDPATPPNLVRELADQLPSARFEPIEQAGHLPCIEQPEAMGASIEQFLTEHGYV